MRSSCPGLRSASTQMRCRSTARSLSLTFTHALSDPSPVFWDTTSGDEHLMPLTEAIRKITSMPAQREHLTDRGLIKVGFYADITVFNPETIIDRATYTNPTALSKGVDDVLVNGQIEYEHGKLTGAMGGSVLRGPGWHGASE